MGMPTISVVMPTYNQEKYIDLAVLSILSQDFTDFEFIIVDDGCTDGTPAYLDTLTDPRIRIIHKPNGGVTSALNAGMRDARGEFVTWVSSDNYSPPWALSAFMGAFKKYPEAGFAYSSYYMIDAANKVKRLMAFNHMLARDLALGNNTGGCASFCYRRVCHETVGYYNEAMRYASDTEMWLRILMKYEAVYVVEPTYFFREHDQAASTTHSNDMWREAGQIVVHSVNSILKQGLPTGPFYGFPPSNRPVFFALLCNFAAKLRGIRGAAPAAAQFYETALTAAPRQHVVETLVALLQTVDPAKRFEVISRLESILSANPEIRPDETVSLVVLTSSLAEHVDKFANLAQPPMVSLDTPGFDRASCESRKTYSHFGEAAAQQLLEKGALG